MDKRGKTKDTKSYPQILQMLAEGTEYVDEAISSHMRFSINQNVGRGTELD